MCRLSSGAKPRFSYLTLRTLSHSAGRFASCPLFNANSSAGTPAPATAPHCDAPVLPSTGGGSPPSSPDERGGVPHRFRGGGHGCGDGSAGRLLGPYLLHSRQDEQEEGHGEAGYHAKIGFCFVAPTKSSEVFFAFFVPVALPNARGLVFVFSCFLGGIQESFQEFLFAFSDVLASRPPAIVFPIGSWTTRSSRRSVFPAKRSVSAHGTPLAERPK